MELYEYWRLLIRHLPLLIATSLFGLGGASYVNFVTDPVYSASADVFVTTPSTTIDIGALATGSNFSEQRVVSYAQIISGPATLGPVIEKLDLGVTTSELAQDINAFAPDGTVLIRINVTGKDPNKVAAIANAVAEQFEQTVQYLEATSASTSTNIKVTPVRQALPNYTPTSPNKLLNSILGFILGFALGSGLVILRIFFDRTVKNEDHLGELPLLGTILYDPTARDTPLLTQVSPYSGRAEAFRHIRTNLQFLGDEQDRKVFAMTSALPNEGKTTTIINLALSLSSAGLRVLLIDADLRRPQLNLFLEIPADKEGVTEILSQAQQLKKFRIDPSRMAVQVSPTFDVLCSGSIPSQPAELLGSDSFAAMIDACRKAYDVILLDCPPTLPITDAAVIATSVDAVILVVKAGKTSIKQFRGTVESLLKVDATILGCVINMIPTSRRSEEYGYRYGYRGYRAYYSYGGGSKSKSLYSPVEPYGPDLNGRAVVPTPEEVGSYTEHDGLQEMREHPERTNSVWQKLFERTLGLLLQRLSRELESQYPEESGLIDADQDTRAPKKGTSNIFDWLRSRNSVDRSLTLKSTTNLELEVEREILEWSSSYAGKKEKSLVSRPPKKSSTSRTSGNSKAKSKKRINKTSTSKKAEKR
jgi:succinoglycan biosynthesis transport protein ExoP